MTVNWSRQEQADNARAPKGHPTVVAEMVHALHAATSPAPGTAQWWAALADDAARLARCYSYIGMATEARRWQGISRDASAQVSAAQAQEAISND